MERKAKEYKISAQLIGKFNAFDLLKIKATWDGNLY